MKLWYINIIFISLLISCFRPNIYNDGTAWKMPEDLKVSDFYYDIENVYQYEGRNQEYRLKVKSFYWQDENNENHIIESAFFIVKRFYNKYEELDRLGLGNLVELENNSFSLTAEELENFKKELPNLIRQERKEPHEYIEQVKNEKLK